MFLKEPSKHRRFLSLFGPLLFLYGILFQFIPSAFSENEFLTFSNTKARAFAMGGAYISVEDDISSVAWNPATFGSCAFGRGKTLFISPITPFIAINGFRDYDRLWRRDDKLTFEESILSLVLSLKGFAIFLPTMSVGILGVEENPDSTGPRFFNSKPALMDHFHVVGISIRPSSSFSFGAALRFYYQQDDKGTRRWGKGTSFGVLLKPNPKVNIGVAYFDLPRSFLGEVDKRLLRIDDETVNAGISYYPNDRMAFSVDLRNLNDESGLAQREIHLGFESRLFPKSLVVRGGYFRKQPGDQDVFSVGFGWTCGSYNKYGYLPGHDVLGYSFLSEETKQGRTKWHIFSLKINI